MQKKARQYVEGFKRFSLFTQRKIELNHIVIITQLKIFCGINGWKIVYNTLLFPLLLILLFSNLTKSPFVFVFILSLGRCRSKVENLYIR